MLEEHGDAALEQVRHGLAAARRARSRKQFGYWKEVETLLIGGSTAIVVDPPSLVLRLFLLAHMPERGVGDSRVASGARPRIVVVDKGGMKTQRDGRRRCNRLEDGCDVK